MHRLTLILVALMALLLSACASTPADTDSAAPPQSTATPPAEATTEAVEPTPLVIPTTGVPTPTATVEPAATPSPTAAAVNPPPTAAATSTPAPTATPKPIPTAIVVSPTPRPVATATPVSPTPTPTSVSTGWVNPDCYVGAGAADEPVWWCGSKICVSGALHNGCPTTPPSGGWVNPDCYVGTGAADEPVWWCGGRICLASAAHYGCPIGPPVRPTVQVSCTISDTDIVVDEIITLRASHSPLTVPVRFAFSHGDGTIDNTSESLAYYEAPGTYRVTLLYQHSGGKGSKHCGTVTVRSTGPTPTPTPTPTPANTQIGCSISPSRTVKVNEALTFTAFQNPPSHPVSFVFDHGDGTLDETWQSHAYYAAPGFYEVRLNWAYANQSGTTLCGTVTVEANIVTGDYLGRTRQSAEALAASRGLVTRVVRIDAEYFPGTTDYRLDRLNLEIDAGKVTKVYIG